MRWYIQNIIIFLLVTKDVEIADQVSDSNAVACGFAAVGRTNSLLRRSERLSSSLLSLLQAINLLMEVKNQVSSI